MKRIFSIFLLSLILLTSCATRKTNSTQTTSTNSSTSALSLQSETSTSLEATFIYTFDPNRPILVDVDGEFRESNSAAFTITTMEAVTSNEFRKQLQDFYNDGADLMYESDDKTEIHEHTGYILVYQGGDLQQKLFVGKENLNVQLGMERYQELLDKEKNEKAVTW